MSSRAVTVSVVALTGPRSVTDPELAAIVVAAPVTVPTLSGPEERNVTD